jgi:hypothetical protein
MSSTPGLRFIVTRLFRVQPDGTKYIVVPVDEEQALTMENRGVTVYHTSREAHAVCQRLNRETQGEGQGQT